MKLKPGEVLCPKCHGSGEGHSWEIDEFKITPECTHCYGDGKLDWVERVTGKPRRGFDYEALTAEMANKLAEEIDKSILEKLKEEADDNRIFSEFVFRPSYQQILKGETD